VKRNDHPLMRLAASSPHKLLELLQNACGVLNERERAILEMRFGLKDGRSYSLEKVGQHFGVSGERIRQIEARALCKLNFPLPPRRSRRRTKTMLKLPVPLANPKGL
jgi:DNA-directed RNA polymerase sigma subunit (sigma70/sigma32)